MDSVNWKRLRNFYKLREIFNADIEIINSTLEKVALNNMGLFLLR